MQEKIYLDTSVPSAVFDFSKPVRQLMTQKWFENESSNYKLFSSFVAIQEIRKTKNEQRRNQILDFIDEFQVDIIDFDDNTVALAKEYINGGAIPNTELEDALHIAVASMNNFTTLVSWNFKHIVSLNPIRKIHEINKRLGFPLVEITTIEMLGGYKYGNI